MKGAGSASALARLAVVGAAGDPVARPGSSTGGVLADSAVSKSGEAMWQVQRLGEYLRPSTSASALQAPVQLRLA
jgi:hypothetical protein